MILYVGLALYFDIGKVSRTVLRINYWTIPSILAPMTVTILLLGLRFHRLLMALNTIMPLRKSLLVYILGLSFAVTPISSGQVLRSKIIKTEFNYAFSKTSPIFLFEKWSELASALVILVVLLLVNFMKESIPVIIIGAVLAFFFFGLIRRRGLFFFLSRKIIGKFQRLKQFEQSIETSRESLDILFSKRVIVEGFVFTIPAQILQAFSVFLAFQALGLDISFIASIQIFYTALIAGIVSFVPGGLGITEGGMIALLSNYYDSYDLSLLAASVIIVRLITFWYPTFLGGVSGIIKYRGFFAARLQSDV